MLTKVIFEGAMAKRFGKEWLLDVNSPAEALRMVNANVPGVLAWIKNNLDVYSRYRVSCTSASGIVEDIVTEEYQLERKLTEIRFTPLIEGSGGLLRIVIGAVMVYAGGVMGQPWMVSAGWGMIVGGVIGLLTPVPKTPGSADNGNSYYFNGPVNTVQQGVPVPLIYGRCLVGSQIISAHTSVDQI